MDIPSPRDAVSDPHAAAQGTGMPRDDATVRPEEADARDFKHGAPAAPVVELYSPPVERAGLGLGLGLGLGPGLGSGLGPGRNASDAGMAVDACPELPHKSSHGPSQHHNAASPRQDAFSAGTLIGMHIGGFRIDRLICNRGLGTVFEGVLEWPPKSVAIKVSRVNCTPDMARGYERRWQAVQALQHPRIAATVSSSIEPWAGLRVPFQVMDYVADAIPLRRFVISRRLSIQQRLDLFREVCDAVAYGHRHGVFHGYLTPHKVLIDAVGRPKVVDYCNFLAFGGCESLQGTGNEPLPIDLCYLSPEQYVEPASKIDARADVYSLGAVLYELLTGQQPYDVDRRSISEAADLIRRTRPLSPRRCNERVTPALMTLLGNCLKKNRFERFSSAQEIVDALDDILDDRQSVSRETDRRGWDRASGRKHAWAPLSTDFLGKLIPRTWEEAQIGSLARRVRSTLTESALPWIGLFLMGWAFLWAAAEIAREALSSKPLHVVDRRVAEPRDPEPSPSAENEF